MDFNESNERIQSPFRGAGSLQGCEHPWNPASFSFWEGCSGLNTKSREKEETEAETRRGRVSEHEKMVARGGNRRMGTIWTWARLRL